MELPFTDDDGRFRDPEAAAFHAMFIQHGFSTPKREAARMILDGGRSAVNAFRWMAGKGLTLDDLEWDPGRRPPFGMDPESTAATQGLFLWAHAALTDAGIPAGSADCAEAGPDEVTARLELTGTEVTIVLASGLMPAPRRPRALAEISRALLAAGLDPRKDEDGNLVLRPGGWPHEGPPDGNNEITNIAWNE